MATAVIIGGGAAGFFAAGTCAAAAPGAQVLILERTPRTLAKVALSGGGRCNLTNACAEPWELIRHYPRGGRELLGPFHRFGPTETMAWFAARGVALATLEDGCVFPASNRAESVVAALRTHARDHGVVVRTGVRITSLSRRQAQVVVCVESGEILADAVLLATGSAIAGHGFARVLGHTIVPPVPSLFALACAERWVHDLSGLVIPEARLDLLDLGEPVSGSGALLCTHTGLSGPATLQASAWGARWLHDHGYCCRGSIRWPVDAPAHIAAMRRDHGARSLRRGAPALLPQRLWEVLLLNAGLTAEQHWAGLNRAQITGLCRQVEACPVTITGRTPHGKEFVTAGGVARDEIDWRTMESRVCPGCFVAGEALDVDGLTGGFNLQNAWTTGHLAGLGMAARLASDR